MGIVCYGNIVRSQLLGIYIAAFLKKRGNKDIKVYSAGTAPDNEFPDTPIRIKEVEDKLKEKGISAKPKRTSWSPAVAKRLRASDVILVADQAIKEEVSEKLKDCSPSSVYTFYEFIGEGEIGLEDTYDYENKIQDMEKIEEAFTEIERIAKKAVGKLLYRKNHNRI